MLPAGRPSFAEVPRASEKAEQAYFRSKECLGTEKIKH
jgi:hypothetical protein